MQEVLGEADAVMGPGDTTGCGDVHMQILAMMRMLCVCAYIHMCAYSFARVAKTRKKGKVLCYGLQCGWEKGNLGCDDIPPKYEPSVLRHAAEGSARECLWEETEPAAAIWRRWVDDRDREAEELSNAMTSGGARWHGWLESAAFVACDSRRGWEHEFPRRDRKMRGIESRRPGRRAVEAVGSGERGLRVIGMEWPTERSVCLQDRVRLVRAREDGSKEYVRTVP